MQFQVNNYENLYSHRFNSIKARVKLKKKYELLNYLIDLEEQLDNLLESLSTCNFWFIFPKILGIDSKITILEEFLEIDLHLKEKELIEMIEVDYKNINKEKFGYRLRDTTPNSLIFYVE